MFTVLRDHWKAAVISFHIFLYTKGEWESYEIIWNYWQTYSEKENVILYTVYNIHMGNLFSKSSSCLSDLKSDLVSWPV